MTDELERVVMLQRLDPDRVEEYLDAHEHVPEAVSAAMDRGGVKAFRLFVRDDISVAYIEVEDFASFNREYMNDPDCQDWEDHVAAFKLSGVDVESGDMPLMDEVWTFERVEGE